MSTAWARVFGVPALITFAAFLVAAALHLDTAGTVVTAVATGCLAGATAGSRLAIVAVWVGMVAAIPAALVLRLVDALSPSWPAGVLLLGPVAFVGFLVGLGIATRCSGISFLHRPTT